MALDVSNADADPPLEQPTIYLNVTYPETYPDTGPYLDITPPPNAPKYPYLDVQADKAQLLDALQPTIEDNMGMAMVFTLVTTLKEVAETLVADRQRQQQEILDVQAAAKEEEENRKFHGTSVTRERFLEWRSKFKIELEEKAKADKDEAEAEERKKRGFKSTDEKKLSGRQLWERGLAGKGDDDIEGDGPMVDGLEKLKVEA